MTVNSYFQPKHTRSNSNTNHWCKNIESDIRGITLKDYLLFPQLPALPVPLLPLCIGSHMVNRFYTYITYKT